MTIAAVRLPTPSPADARASGGPIYIGGLDRSGKTTMAAFLTSHPRIVVPAVGTNMWTYFYRQYGDLAESANFERCLDALLHYKHVAFLEPDAARIRREFAAGAPTYARLFELIHQHHRERVGKPRYGVQTGLVERYADELFAAYPGVRVIHMIRDPRDRYEASLALWPDGRGRAGGAAARWRYSVGLAERNRRRYGDRYLVVRFEDLVRWPADALRHVCRFLGEQFHEEMLGMPEAPSRRARMREFARREEADLLSQRAIGHFRGRVTDDELAFLQLQLRAPMRRHGYAPDLLDRDLRARVRFLAAVWPDQWSRMVAWRGVEALQQRLPEVVRRRPGARMVLRAQERVP
jgi:hypothetical protein